MPAQKIKLVCGGSDFYFTDRAFMSAYMQAESFIKRNKRLDIRMYVKNTAPFGDTWLPCITKWNTGR